MPGARLQVARRRREHHRADGDARSSAAPGKDVADGAAVRAAPVALELGDDLHRPHLRRARRPCPRGSTRAGGRTASRRRGARPTTSDTRCVTCEKRSASRKRSTSHRAGHADAREVVAAEVDEHDVLGAVLLRREQALGVGFAPAASSRDRVQVARLPSHFTRVSGDEPISARPSSSSRNRYGDGLTRRSARYRSIADPRTSVAPRAAQDDLEPSAARMNSLRAQDGVLVVGLRRESRASPGAPVPRGGVAETGASSSGTSLGRRRGPRPRRGRGRSGSSCRRRRSGSRGGGPLVRQPAPSAGASRVVVAR